jgi:hypothetical protein
MKTCVRRLTILSVLFCVASTGGQSFATNPGPSALKPAPTVLGPVADLPPLVRLRKMHLARPDLIPYPIYIEVFC